MTIEKLKGLLTAIEILNSGINHACEYAIDQLPARSELCASLDAYFSNFSTRTTPAQAPAHWHIQIEALGPHWESVLHARLMHWFFDQEYSPGTDETNKRCLVEQTLEYIRELCGELEVFEIVVRPPMWYDCQWQDFAFTSPSGKWLLHLGFSD